MVTLATLPCFTSSMNWEYSIAFCPACRVLNWLKTVISTSAITSQIATFLIRLFNDAPCSTRRAVADPPQQSLASGSPSADFYSGCYGTLSDSILDSFQP